MLKKILGRTLAVCMVVASAACLCIGMSAHSFRDVYEYDEAIDLLSSIEVIKGYSNTTFSPNDNITRWQMALLMSKLVTGSVETSRWESASAGTAFTDVQASRHYPAAINYAHNNGIIIGRDSVTFAPDDNITVQDGITMCVRALGYPRSSYDSGYPDSYIAKGKELGLFEGLYNLSYTASLTRGQTAQLLYNALFAPTYSGATLADDAFGFVDCNIVLAATETLRFDSTDYADRGTYIFREINDYGRLGEAYTLDADLFDFDDANAALGTMYSVRATDDFKTILSLELVSKTLTSKSTGSLSVNTAKSTISLGGYEYTPKGLRSYALETGKSPSNKEIIIYALHDDIAGNQYKSGNVLTAAKMAGTTGYYSITAYDDNGDGYADRAFYKSYAFGQYKLESNALAIAGGNRASDIKITGKTTVKDGDYVLYCFDSQTKVLDIYKILTAAEGTISSYDATNGKITVDNVLYSLGTDTVPGAKTADLAKIFGTTTSVNGRKLTYYADSDTKIIFAAELQGEELSLEGNYYYNNIGVITQLTYTTAYDISYTGQASTTPQTYPVIQLNGSNYFLVNSVNGTAASTANIQSLIKTGDIVSFTSAGTKLVYGGTNGSYQQQQQQMTVLNLTDCSNKASFTTSSTNNVIHVKLGTNSLPVLYIRENGVDTKAISLNSNCNLYIMTGNGYGQYSVSPISYSQLIDGSFELDTTEGSTKKGYPLQTGYYSFYIDGISSTFYNSTITANAIYIRPFDFSNYAASSSAYNGIVYVGQTSVNYPQQYGYGTAASYVYTGVTDLSSGNTTTVYLPTSKGRLSTAGYYKTLNGYITDPNPVTTSIIPSTTGTSTTMGASTSTLTLLLNPTVSAFYPSSNFASGSTTTTGYVINANNSSYYPTLDSLRLCQMTTTSTGGYGYGYGYGSTTTTPTTTSSLRTISRLNSDGSVNNEFTYLMQYIQSNPALIKAIYIESTIQYGSYYPATSVFCVII